MKEYESKTGGWNEDAFEDIGLMEASENVARLDYEIKNCVCITIFESLVMELHELASSIEAIAGELENELD